MPSTVERIFRKLWAFQLPDRIVKRHLLHKEKQWAVFIASGDPVLSMPLPGGGNLHLDRKMGSSKKLFVYDAERDEVECAFDLLHPGDTFLDIGAHIGYFTVSGSAKVGKNGTVISFEPTAATLVRLRENIRLNQLTNVLVCSYALSDKAEHLKLYSQGNEAYNTLAGNTQTGNSSEIETILMDDYLLKTDHGGRLDLIKIDVEGWEVPALRGGLQSIRKFHPVIMLEYSFRNQRNAGLDPKDLGNLLENEGYRLFHFDHKARQLKKFVFDPLADTGINLLAIHDLDAFVARQPKWRFS